MNLTDYNYFLPEKNLALEPAVPRDSSKLFVYNTQTNEIVFDHFDNLDKYLPENSFLVLNNTKVLPARVVMTRLRQGFDGQEKGKVTVLFLVNESVKKNTIRVMVDREVNIGEKLFFQGEEFVEVLSHKEHIFVLKYLFSKQKLFELLEKYGVMPIPPYLKKSTLTRDELIKKYQTIFAKTDGSAAAPTASLHFTDEVFKKIEKKGLEKFFVTLHVGLGTFAPINDKNIEEKRLHEEYYEVPEGTFQSINRLKKEGKRLVAVGTTVVRTLESIAKIKDQKSKLHIKNEKESLTGKTDLFILPPYDFKLVDAMITNFHLPKSSLMMLVEAFLEFKGAKKNLVDLYEIAVKNNFRFYSFGDAMLLV